MCSMCGKNACAFTADAVEDELGSVGAELGATDAGASGGLIAPAVGGSQALQFADSASIDFGNVSEEPSGIGANAGAAGVYHLDFGGEAAGQSGAATAVQPAQALAAPANAGAPAAVNANGEVPGSTASTYTIELGKSVYGALEVLNDQDWYRVDLVAGTTYEFRLHGVGVNQVVDPFIGLRDAAGAALDFNDDSPSWSNASGQDSRLTFTAITTGTHFINATSFEGGHTGNYLLTAVEANPFGMVFTADEIAWQLTNNFAEQTGGAGPAAFNVGADGRITVNVTALAADGRELCREALRAWEDVTGIDFVETAGAAEITFRDIDPGGQATTAYANTAITNGVITSANVVLTQGWLTQFGNTLNSYSFETYIHEIGHAIGLGHGGNYNGSATYGTDNYYLNDSVAYAIMSYMNARNDEFTQGGTGQNTFVNASFRYMMTAAISDIIAIHNLYGDNSSVRTGNTTYGFNSNTGRAALDAAVTFGSSMAMTVYDDGGLDTLDFNNTALSQLIDLEAESFSNVLGGVSNLSIARGTVIERAFGGANNDILRGNAVANTLEGRNGRDALQGRDGNDTLDGGNGNDTIEGGNGADWLRGGAAADTMTGGADGDRFDFNAVADIGNAAGARDVITDFQTGVDLIDLDGIDALTTAAGVQHFTWLGTAAHTGAGATLRFQQTGGNTLVFGDTNANGGADFTLQLTGLHNLTAADFSALTINIIRGTNAADTLLGAPGGKQMLALGGNDSVVGGTGADVINGAAGFDTMTGGASADRFDFNAVAEIGNAAGQRDVITDFQKGVDKIDLDGVDALTTAAGIQHFTWLGAGAHTGAGATLRHQEAGGNTLIYGDVNADGVGDFTIQLLGVYALDAADFTNLSITSIQGSSAADTLVGAPGGKAMLGLDGNDTIIGGAGADTIFGGAGADSISGGLGADQFKWSAANHSGINAGTRDIITDFQKGADKLDLSAIDANTTVAGNQAFTFLGTAPHTGAGATLRFQQSGGNTLIFGDVNADGGADFVIQLTGAINLAASDFVL